MGLFDFFDEANAQFKKDVSKAWKELWSSDSSNDDDDDTSYNDDDDEKSSSSILRDLMDIAGPVVHKGPYRSPFQNPLKEINQYKRQASAVNSLLNGGTRCTKPVAGTPVYCKLAGAVEHTGIYIGNGEIAHLSGDGNIEAVSPEEFCARLDGLNPTRTIYFAQYDGKALGTSSIADRARSKLGSTRNYNLVFDNCHQFTCGCISGDFENPCNFFWMVEAEITDKLGSFVWETWNKTFSANRV